MSFGLCASARAIAARCACPPDSVSARWPPSLFDADLAQQLARHRQFFGRQAAERGPPACGGGRAFRSRHWRARCGAGPDWRAGTPSPAPAAPCAAPRRSIARDPGRRPAPRLRSDPGAARRSAAVSSCRCRCCRGSSPIRRRAQSDRRRRAPACRSGSACADRERRAAFRRPAPLRREPRSQLAEIDFQGRHQIADLVEGAVDLRDGLQRRVFVGGEELLVVFGQLVQVERREDLGEPRLERRIEVAADRDRIDRDRLRLPQRDIGLVVILVVQPGAGDLFAVEFARQDLVIAQRLERGGVAAGVDRLDVGVRVDAVLAQAEGRKQMARGRGRDRKRRRTCP